MKKEPDLRLLLAQHKVPPAVGDKAAEKHGLVVFSVLEAVDRRLGPSRDAARGFGALEFPGRKPGSYQPRAKPWEHGAGFIPTQANGLPHSPDAVRGFGAVEFRGRKHG